MFNTRRFYLSKVIYYSVHIGNRPEVCDFKSQECHRAVWEKEGKKSLNHWLCMRSESCYRKIPFHYIPEFHYFLLFHSNLPATVLHFFVNLINKDTPYFFYPFTLTFNTGTFSSTQLGLQDIKMPFQLNFQSRVNVFWANITLRNKPLCVML